MIGTLQLWNLHGLLNGLVHGNLSLRHNRDIGDLVGELREWNLHCFLHCLGRGHLSLHNNGYVTSLVQELRLWKLDGLGPPVDLLLDDEPSFSALSAR